MSDRDTRPPDSRPPAPRLPEGEQATPSRLRSDAPRPDRTERAAPALRRLAAWLLRSADGRFIVDDLDELHARDLGRGLSPWRARCRYARNLVASTWTVRRARPRVAGRAGVSWLDFKLGIRMLAKYPGLTVVGGLAMAFAIAAGATTFEFANTFARPSLPLPDGDRIVALRLWNVSSSRVERRAVYDFASWRASLETVRDLGAFRQIERNLIVAGGQGEPIALAEISASAFRVARTRPLLGRTLVDADEAADAPPVVVIGERVWRGRFGADAGVVGREVRLGGVVHTVVGVMPEDYAFPVNHEVWTPLRLNPLEYGPRTGPAIRVFGRLGPGVTLEEARAELNAVGARTAAAYPDTHEHLLPQIRPYAHTYLNPTNDEFLLVAASMNAFVVLFLILVCANVAALVFARTTTRESEIVVRSALGASRGRIVAQLFAEALVLGGLAAAVGLTAAQLGIGWGVGVLEEVSSERLPFWVGADLSVEAVLYAGLLTVIGAIVAGVLPAFKATRGLQSRLRAAGVGGAGPRFGRLWTGVIVTQVAFTVAFLPFLIIAGRDTALIAASEFGYPAEEYLSARLELDRPAVPGRDAEAAEAEFRARLLATYEEFERRLAAEPAVAAVTFASQVPGGGHARRLFEVEGGPAPSGSTLQRQVQSAFVDLGFFEALRTPVLSGRGFHSGDLDSGAPVVIVNRSFVNEFLAGRNPIGRRVRYLCGEAYCRSPDPEPGPWHEIVGVVEDLPLTIDPDLPHNAGLYHPFTPAEPQPMRLVVHVRGDPEAFAPRLRVIAAAVDPGLRLYDPLPLDEIHRDLLTTYTFWLRIGFVGGCLVLLLSTVGIYSILSFTVSRRTREIGVRIALGADRRRIVAAVFSRALGQIGLGLVAGAGLLVALTGGIPSRSQIGLIVAGVAVMAAVGLFACIAPARRALRIEPTEALKADA